MVVLVRVVERGHPDSLGGGDLDGPVRRGDVRADDGRAARRLAALCMVAVRCFRG